jgi:MOSC domain-containing protein YiiM
VNAHAVEAVVEAVSADVEHRFAKHPQNEITLLAGFGVEGDAHAGATVQHRSRARSLPNLRQVHLVHGELLDELVEQGFRVGPGSIGENVLTRGLDVLALPAGTRLHLGSEAVVEVTGLRNPCRQLDRYQKGLMAAVLARDEDGNLVRKSGVMSVVLTGGVVRPGDPIDVRLPAGEHRLLEVV